METEDDSLILTLPDGRKIDMSARADEKLVTATAEMKTAADQLRFLSDIMRANLFVDETGRVRPLMSQSEFNEMHANVLSLRNRLVDAKQFLLNSVVTDGGGAAGASATPR